ncbi:MAG TPA: phosphoribosylanthranilate isomerase [Vicinamibacterales bacterium]|nr:phosphoribosylanthranilate isomerase [Vicinamibacterales bacterium]
MLIKICGITRQEDADLAVALGASALGFVFWPASPRFVDPYRAKRIVASLPIGIAAVGVFVDQPIGYVNGVAALARLTGVQLHGGESIDFARGVTRPVLKAVALSSGGEPAGVDAWPARVTLLADVHDPARRGGTGRTVDWAVAAGLARRRRLVLAGGLTPDNVGEAVRVVRPFGVDVSSGVEARPGVKDPQKLRAFLSVVRGMEEVHE